MNFSNFFKSKSQVQAPSFGGVSVSSNINFTPNINGLSYYKNWVYASVNARSRAVSMIKLRLMRRGEEVLEHEILKLVDDIDFKVVQSFLDLTGNAYIYIAKDNNGKGKPAKLYPVSPAMIKPVMNKSNLMNIAYYQSGTTQIPTEDIIHFKNFNPNAPYPHAHLGASVLSAISNTVEIDEASRKWNFSFFKNSARPDGLLTTDQDLTEEDIQRINEDFISKYGGVDNSHKIGFLGGGMKFVSLSSTQKDIDFVEQNRLSRDEILACFGVPKSEIGIVDDVNRANAETSNYVFMKNTVDPLMKQISSTLQYELVNRYFKNEDLKIDYWSPIPRDEASKLVYYTAGVDKWLTRNEIRKEEGYPEVKGGDSLFNNLSSIEIATDSEKSLRDLEKRDNTPDFKGLSKAIGDAIEGIEKKEQIVIDTKKKEINSKSFTHFTAEAKTAHIKAWDSIMKSKEAEFLKETRKYFSKQEKKVLEMLNTAEKSFSLNIISSFFAGAEWEKEISVGVSLITPRIMEYIISGAENANTTIGNDTPLEINRRVEDFVKSRATFFSQSINDTTKNTLLDAIKKGNDSGMSNTEIVDQVKSIYVGISDHRAKTIVRTEISASANFGSVEQYKQAGVTHHEWLVVHPEDDDCLVNEGVVVKIGENFPSGVDNSPVHPNCQCTTIAVFS